MNEKTQEELERELHEQQIYEAHERAAALRAEERAKQRAVPELGGYIQSGLLFIGDPVYFSGDTREDVPADPCNPFRHWDSFTSQLGKNDLSLPFPGAIEASSGGRGLVIQLGGQNGQYEAIKELNADGSLSQIIIRIKP